MEILTAVLAIVAFFVLFLMLTSGQRKRQLEKALNILEKDKIKLMKSIEHVKISFYQKKLNEKEAQDKIFEYEEKLREIEEKIGEIRDKPLMRTLKKQQAIPKDQEIELVQETEEVKRAEGFALKDMGASAIVALFIVVIIAIIIGTAMINNAHSASSDTKDEPTEFEIPLDASSATDGTYPGSTGGLRVHIQNDLDKDLENVIVTATPPDGSGIRFTEGQIGLKKIAVLEAGGSRELFFSLSTDSTMEEGEYIITIDAINDAGLKARTTAKLNVRWIVKND